MTTQQLWRAIHVYPRVRGVERFNDLLASVRELLPCGDCQRHFDEYLIRCPPDTSSREALFAWGVQFHNAVNASIAKPQVTLEDARERWQTAGRCRANGQEVEVCSRQEITSASA